MNLLGSDVGSDVTVKGNIYKILHRNTIYVAVQLFRICITKVKTC